MKIRQVGAELFHAADGRTGGQKKKTKLIVACRNFANAPNNVFLLDYWLCQCFAQQRTSLCGPRLPRQLTIHALAVLDNPPTEP